MDDELYYFDKDGNPLDLLSWGKLRGDLEYRLVAEDSFQTRRGRAQVRTVWLGFREPMCGADIFGTAVRFDGGPFEEVGNWPNKEIAGSMHEKIVKELVSTGRLPTHDELTDREP